MSSLSKLNPERAVVGLRRLWPLMVCALAIVVIAESIRSVTIPIGSASIVIYPMVWGLLLGLVVSLQRFKPMGIDLQKAASAVVTTAVLILVARLAFNIGPSLSLLASAGPALILQEVGHLLGTIGLALPLAVLLKMGPSTVGATFSLDREPAFAMVSEKFGADSDQYRGVLAMYVFGTLFGALYITFLASFVTSMHWFDPLALAMGAGVGSGSMMAAATGSIVSLYPDQEQGITAIAAVSNLLTTVAGVYVGIYVALPLAQKMYNAMVGRRGQRSAVLGEVTTTAVTTGAAAEAEAEDNRSFREAVAQATSQVTVPLWVSLPTISVLGIATAAIYNKGFSLNIVWAYLLMNALVLGSMALANLTRVISAIVYITTIGAAITSPWSPIGGWISDIIKAVPFLSVATIMLSLAGLSLGKDIPLLRRIGWKIVPVGLVAITASFLLAALIAEFTLGFWG